MEYTDDMKNRLKRVEGQVRGVLRMMEEQKECKEVIYQLTAVRTAIDKATAYIIAKNMEHCMREYLQNGESAEEVIQEAVKLLVKSR
jgi:DNA-binding FrmR family transcriptional regulator